MKFRLICLLLFLALTACGQDANAAKYAQTFETLLTAQRAGGITLAGGKVYFYVPGTTTLKTVYTDRLKTTPAANPATLDANGTIQIFGDGLYDIKVTNSADVQKFFWEDVLIQSSASALAALSDYSNSLATAVTSIGATRTTLLIDVDNTVSTDVTVPATLEIVTVNGAIITISSGKTLTVNGPCDSLTTAGAGGLVANGAITGNPSFSNTGTVTLAGPRAEDMPAWWGATGNGTTDDSAALDKWFTSVMTTKAGAIPTGTYLNNGLSTDLTLNPWSVNIHGVSTTGTQFKLKNSSNTDVLSVNKGQTNPAYWPSFWRIRDLLIDGNIANNTSGNGLHLFQVNEFGIDNVNISNVAGYMLYVDESIGLAINGPNIWDTSSADSDGGVYFKNSSNVMVNNIAIQGLSGTSAWPVTIEKTATHANPQSYNLNQLYLEANYNGIKIDASTDDSTTGVSVNIDNPELIGLAANGGTCFDISGDETTRVIVRGGSVYNAWGDRLKTSASATAVVFDNVNGISDASVFQQDKGGVTRLQPGAIQENLIHNGNFERWRADYEVPAGPFGFNITGATPTKDTSAYKIGTAGFKLVSTTTLNYIEYTLTADELGRAKGKTLHASVWAKGTSASAADVAIITLGGAAPSQVSDTNDDTDWLHLHSALKIPTDVTGVVIRARVAIGKTVTFDGFSASINCDIPYKAKSISSYGDIPVAATAALPVAATVMDGTILIEDAGDGNRNLIIYTEGQRFRIDGGANI